MYTLFIDSKDFSNIEQFFYYLSAIFLSDRNDMEISNFDSLADVIEGGFGPVSYGENIQVKWKGFKKSVKDLGVQETVKYLTKRLQGCHPSAREEVKEQIIFAQTEDNYTLFYFILGVFMDADNVKSVELF